MKTTDILGLIVLAALLLVTLPARAADTAGCTKEQLLAFSPKPDEVKAHRQFPLPYISYPFGTQMPEWGFNMLVRIDESGRVVCYQISDRFRDEPLPLNEQRRTQIRALKDWRYTPFTRNGQPMASIVAEFVNERELPERHVPLPNVSLETVTISLERQGCFGSCPGYKVTVRGNGRATYEGHGDVDVLGTHHYRVQSQVIAELIERVRASDLWSLRSSYRAGITDNPTYILAIKLGEQEHQLEDYVGQMAGMPSTISDLEDEVDKAAGAEGWIHLSEAALAVLKAEHFNFASPAATDLLARAVRNEETHDDGAMLHLISLGVAIEGARLSAGFRSQQNTLIDEALNNRRAILIDPLIAKGALSTDDKPDQHKIDSAFRASISGGSLALVQKLWTISADEPHPSLTFNDVSDDQKPVHKRVPVTLLLSHRYKKGPWDGLAIAKWLIAQGCDMKASKADGTTLLHIATQSGDIEFVRYLLKQGFNASTPGKYALPALGSAEDEDIALLLLQAGTDMTKMNGSGNSFHRFAEDNHWGRVIEWLKSHGQ